jgi:hypothetical protein
MSFLHDRLGVPRKLSSKLWMITIPSAVVSFERRSDVPRLPGTGKALGGVLLAGAAIVGMFSMRSPGTSLAYEGPLAPVVQRPATLAGLMGLAGLAFLLRSTSLLLYSAGLAAAGGTGQVALDEPSAGTLLGRGKK